MAEKDRKGSVNSGNSGNSAAETLPEDLLVHIFQFLGGGSGDQKYAADLASIDAACRSWRRPHGWHCLSLTEVAAQYICQHFRFAGLDVLRTSNADVKLHQTTNGGSATSTAHERQPPSWKQLLHNLRRCSVDCWCNFCKCEIRVEETKVEAGAGQPAHDRSLERRVRPKNIIGLCRSCACCLPNVKVPSGEDHHLHFVQVPWKVFEKDSKLTTLFSYKDGWEKKPLWLSPPFWLDQLEWRVMCFPKGVPSGPSGCISLFLECASLCKCMCHTREGGEHHFHTGSPHPEHLDQAPATLSYDSISVSFSLSVVRPQELNSGARVHSVSKEATHNYRFGVPVDSGWRNMVSSGELELCREESNDGNEAYVHVEVRVKVNNIKRNGTAVSTENVSDPGRQSLSARLRTGVRAAFGASLSRS